MFYPIGALDFYALAAPSPSAVTSEITPYLPFAGIVAGAILMGVFNARNRRKGNIETRAPEVNEIWAEQARLNSAYDLEVKFRRKLQNWGSDLLWSFRGYVRRVQDGGSPELTQKERGFFDGDLPTSEITTQE